MKSLAGCCICLVVYILHVQFLENTGQGCEHHLCSLSGCLNMGTCIHQCTLTVRFFDRSLAPVQTSSQASHDLAGLQAFAATGEDIMRR